MNNKRQLLKHFFTRSRHIAPITQCGLSIVNAGLRFSRIKNFSRRIRALEYLNIGCGKRMVPHMINLNYEWYPGIDLVHDIAHSRLPLQTGQMRGVYTEHVLEHLDVETLPFVFSEIRRVLMPRGILRVLVPDAGLYLKIYQMRADKVDVRFPDHNARWTDIQHVNRVFRDYGHLFAFDQETLSKFLRDAGFEDITPCAHREGSDPMLLVDSEARASESLRLEAVSPGPPTPQRKLSWKMS